MAPSRDIVVDAGRAGLSGAARGGTATDALLAWVDRRRWTLWGFLLLCYLAAFSGQWRLGPDTSLYVSLGRNLARGAGYHSVGWVLAKGHFGLPLILEANFRLFGPDTFWPAVTLIWLMGVAALALVYRFYLFHIPRPQAVVLTLLVGISFTFSEFLYELLTDIPAFLGVMAALTAFEAVVDQRPARGAEQRGGIAESPSHPILWTMLLVGGLALAVIMRPVNWTLLMAISVALAWRMNRGARRWWTAAGLGALMAGALIYCVATRNTHTGTSYSEALYKWLQYALPPGQPGATLRLMWNYTLNLVFGTLTLQAYFTSGFGPVVSNIAAVVLLAGTFWSCRRRVLWMLWLGGTLLLLLVYPEPQTRYFLPILPLLALGFWQIAAWVGRWPTRSLAAGGLAACLALWVVPNAARLGRLAYLQHATPFLLHVTNGRYVPLRDMATIVRDKLPLDAVIVSQEAPALEAFARDRKFILLLDSKLPPDLLPQLPSLADHGLLFAVDAEGLDMGETFALEGLTEGPALATVPREAWDLPRVPERWFSHVPLPVPNPLVLRPVTRSATDRPSTDRSGSEPGAPSH